MHEEILDTLDDQIVRYRSTDRVIVYANRAFVAANAASGVAVVGKRLDDVATPEVLAAACAGESVDAEGRVISWSRQVVRSCDGCDDVLAVGRDVTSHRDAQAQLSESEARFRELADRSVDVVFRFVLEPVPHFTYLSPSIEKMLGYSPDDFDDFERFLDIVRDEDAQMIRDVIGGAPMPDRYDMYFRRPDGSTVIGELQVRLMADGLLGIGRDVTEVRELQAKLAALALRDPLTGLANRRLLDEVLGLALKRTDRAGQPLAVALLDLDGFKTVNDTHGHDAGDAVLIETARRLSTAVRDADVVARIGGDEFVIVHEAIGPDVAGFVGRLTDILSGPIDLGDGVTVTCPASIGVVDTSTIGRDPVALLAAADSAMYDVKRSRRQR